MGSGRRGGFRHVARYSVYAEEADDEVGDNETRPEDFSGAVSDSSSSPGSRRVTSARADPPVPADAGEQVFQCSVPAQRGW